MTEREHEAEDLTQIVYASRPFGYDESILLDILIGARSNNAKNGITGALICRSDVYMQLLEGPSGSVEAAYERIARDDRHIEVTCLLKSSVTSRLFGDWEMLHDPARSWLWSQAEVADGAITDAQPNDVIAIFERLSADAYEAAAEP
ncbi:MAG: BLUF domain-containing protein [Devosia sp.]